ncbi:hypothetical protein [Candidatus Hodgkinia cicadicola]
MLSKLINYIMKDGKKRMVMLILKKSLDYINVQVIHKSIESIIWINR